MLRFGPSFLESGGEWYLELKKWEIVGYFYTMCRETFIPRKLLNIIQAPSHPHTHTHTHTHKLKSIN